MEEMLFVIHIWTARGDSFSMRLRDTADNVYQAADMLSREQGLYGFSISPVAQRNRRRQTA